MEFNEKLQELRKGRSLTQEELAEALFVSRTAVSKWESGRGYPSIESLRQSSRYFSVSIDELICPEEILSAAEDDRKAREDKALALICGTLDILSTLLLFLPVFGNGADSPGSVPLFSLTGCSPWIRNLSAAVIGVTVLNGLWSVTAVHFEKPLPGRRRLFAGMELSVTGVAVFILTRQPYAGIFALAILVVKGWLIWKKGGLSA